VVEVVDVDDDVDVEDVVDVVVVSSTIRRDVNDEIKFNFPKARPIVPKMILAFVFFEKFFHFLFFLPSLKIKFEVNIKIYKY
jgi:hypothetical protein